MARSVLRIVTAATLVAGLLISGQAALAQKGGPPDTGPGTSTAARKYLEGRWGLLSFDVFPPGKPVVHVGGQGSLLYDAFGGLKGEIRVPPDVVDPLRLAGVPSDNGVISLDGRTVIDMQAHTLTYFLDKQPPPGTRSGPLSLSRKRYWVVEGNVLTLTTKGDDGKDVSVAKWRKIERQ
jgi:hypothetical protein